MKIIIVLFFPILLLAQTEDDFSIRILQDKRMENSPALYSHLASQHERERELALLAIANIQDTSAVDLVVPLLSDDSPKVRSMAAFALGMIGKPKAATALFRRLSVERNDKCMAEIFNAIGMCGTIDDLKHLVKLSESFPAKWKPHAAVSVMRFGNRKIKDAAATKYVASMLTDNASLLNATYALMRISDTTIIKKNHERLLELARNGSPLIRMWSTTMLGAIDDDASLTKLLALAKRDKDWRVRVNAVRALRTKNKFRNEMLSLLADKNEHVALTAMTSYDAMTAGETNFKDSTKVISILSSNAHASSVKEEARKYVAKKLGEQAIPLIGTWKSDQAYISAQRVRALNG
ncbi:MAG: HEAT repeat domain-containing protein [Ignavibacteriales bacterium]|nr:HEAT repeat domain-containing protein [Ignavibacteriales bacterium]